ncbi:MAG: hypothetical protein ACP5NF_12065, partial [Thermoanaerobaculum sp.]
MGLQPERTGPIQAFGMRGLLGYNPLGPRRGDNARATVEEKLTPAMRQWRRVKDQHPDKLVLFRMGDFY